MMSPVQTGSSFVVTVVQWRTVSLFVAVVPLLFKVLLVFFVPSVVSLPLWAPSGFLVFKKYPSVKET